MTHGRPWRVDHMIMINVTSLHFDQSTKQLIVGHTTICDRELKTVLFAQVYSPGAPGAFENIILNFRRRFIHGQKLFSPPHLTNVFALPPKENKKLSYRRGTARCVVSVEILPIATQQCKTTSRPYDNSWTKYQLSLIDPCDKIVL